MAIAVKHVWPLIALTATWALLAGAQAPRPLPRTMRTVVCQISGEYKNAAYEAAETHHQINAELMRWEPGPSQKRIRDLAKQWDAQLRGLEATEYAACDQQILEAIRAADVAAKELARTETTSWAVQVLDAWGSTLSPGYESATRYGW